MYYIKKQLIFIFLFTISIAFSFSAQTQKGDNYYFNPIYGNFNISITAPQVKNGFIDDLLSKSIDKVNKNGGGIITIKNGNYKFKTGVFFKSNVHIHIESGVKFNMDATGVMFTAKSTTHGKPVSNFSIVGLGKKKSDSFTINFKYGNSENESKKNTFLKLGYTSNFKISNVRIKDSFTKISSIVLSADVNFLSVAPYIATKKNKKGKKLKSNNKNRRTNLINEVFGVPSKGIIENIHTENASYGYGVIQMQSGNNIVYRNLSGKGGVTLRLESGLNVNQLFRPVGSKPIYNINGFELPLTIDKQPKIDLVFANNISCENGHAAFTMSPHTVKQGSVFLSKIRTISCEAGGEVSKGFVNNFKREEKAGLAVSKFNIEKGSFSSNSSISDVIAVFGQYAQIKSKNFRYIPCELRIDRGTEEVNVGLSIKNGLDFESRRGPSLFPFHYTAAAMKIGDGGYRVNMDVSTIIGKGFGSSVKVITIKGDYVCDKSTNFTTKIRGKKKEKGKKLKKVKKDKKKKN